MVSEEVVVDVNQKIEDLRREMNEKMDRMMDVLMQSQTSHEKKPEKDKKKDKKQTPEDKSFYQETLRIKALEYDLQDAREGLFF